MYNMITESIYQQIKQEYNNGMSLTSIGKKYHVDRGKLSKRLKKDGVEIINHQNEVTFNENFFDVIDTEEKAYWLGFMYADGYVSKKDGGIELSLKSSDINHLRKFTKSLDFTNKHLFQDDIRCRITFRNKHMRQSLINLGCVPQKSLILTCPNKTQVPSFLFNHFARGYVDGDGYIGIGLNHKKERTKPRINVLGTEKFLTGFVSNLGWKNNIRKHNNIFCVEYSGKYVMDYLDQIYSNAMFYLDRKYEIYQTLKEICRR